MTKSAHEILGLTIDEAGSAEKIRAAYRSAVLAQHPDKSGLGEDINMLRCAKESLLRRIGIHPESCPIPRPIRVVLAHGSRCAKWIRRSPCRRCMSNACCFDKNCLKCYGVGYVASSGCRMCMGTGTESEFCRKDISADAALPILLPEEGNLHAYGIKRGAVIVVADGHGTSR